VVNTSDELRVGLGTGVDKSIRSGVGEAVIKEVSSWMGAASDEFPAQAVVNIANNKRRNVPNFCKILKVFLPNP
jgi:hypothetical protein